MNLAAPELLLVGAVAAVGVLHTMVPDHWVPITLVARQRVWSTAQTARAALTAGTGHVVSTLLIALVVWIAGVATAKTFGNLVDTIASLALVGFGGWIAISALLEIRNADGHAHADGHGHDDHHHHGYPHEHGPEAPAGPDGAHEHVDPKRGSRVALLLILGSSPMVEGIPAFFAAGKYGVGLIAIMSLVFAATTMATYLVLCVVSVASLRRVSLGPLERYGEVLSGAFIAVIGLVFWLAPAL